MEALMRFIGELLAAIAMLLLVLLTAWGCLAALDGIGGIAQRMRLEAAEMDSAGICSTCWSKCPHR